MNRSMAAMLLSLMACTSLTAHAAPSSTLSAPVTVFADDFEHSSGWTYQSVGRLSALPGDWEIADPAATYSGGMKQLDSVISGTKALVTGAAAGLAPNDYDVDAGGTVARSPAIALPATGTLTLSFFYNFAHDMNATADDYLRVRVIGKTTAMVFEQRAAAANADGVYKAVSVDISRFAGQTVHIEFEAADNGTPSLVEAAIDDLKVISQ